jgi:hypothetical protein
MQLHRLFKAVLLAKLIAVGLATAAEPQPAAAPNAVSISVHPNSPWSVTGGDDIAQLKRLISGIGWEFEPNADTTAGLKAVGVKTIRCINVEPLPGRFAPDGSFAVEQPDRLLGHLHACRELNARPHVILATALHPDLQLTVEDVKQQPSIMGLIPTGTFGPKDWPKFRRYCQAYFEYVMVVQQFPDAEFEVGNEPDTGGAICPAPPKPASGSRALYEAYFNLYRNVAQAATEFEQQHPGLKVRLGGPALAWAFTFKYGEFNWAERFLKDCGAEKIKLDFLGLHYYGNLSSINGEYPANYPSFREMLKSTTEWRDRYCPEVPIWFTEWGATYQTTNEPQSVINGNYVGAAWSAAFLNSMLENRVDAALYLVTTDLRQPVKDRQGAYENVWGWPSLFVNPQIFGRAYPKAPYHVFEMISRLEGNRVKNSGGQRRVNCIASADRDRKRMTILAWNYGLQLPESGTPVEMGRDEAVSLRVDDAGGFFGTGSLRMRRWMVAKSVGDAYARFASGQSLDAQSCALQDVDRRSIAIVDDQLRIDFTLPSSSVSLVEISAE